MKLIEFMNTLDENDIESVLSRFEVNGADHDIYLRKNKDE